MAYNSEQVRELYSQYTVNLYPRGTGVVMERGKGALVWDLEGREYIDFTSGIGVTSLGHAHPEVTKVALDQIEKFVHSSNSFYNAPHAMLAEKLCTLSGYDKAFFSNSGAEANEAAFKLARKWGHSISKDKKEIISFDSSFHGRTLGTISATGSQAVKGDYEPLIPGFYQIPAFDIEALKAKLNENTAAFIFEPIIARDGLIFPKAGFIEELVKLREKHQFLIIVDEMQSGIGRTGELFGYMNFDFKPDIVSMAKGLATGFPIGATLCNDEVAVTMQVGTHGTTFGGNPLSCAVGTKVLEIISTPEFKSDVLSKGTALTDQLKQIANRYPGILTSVRGVGMMVGAELGVQASDFVNKLSDEGLMCMTGGKDSIRIYPPLVATSEQIERGVQIIEKVCATF
ncbi:MAG: acetylornithine/succinylornithine family transaminase [Deltaproteobacteria bacterium]|nr:acetylornithine/succinylornithine family transaminase [Deltaproteobacteria bacterium]